MEIIVMVKRMHLNLSFSRANTRLANIIKAPFKKCNRNMNKVAEGDFASFVGGGMTHSVEVVNFAHRVHRNFNISDTPDCKW